MSSSTKILLIIAILGAIMGGIGVPDAIKMWKDDIDALEDVAADSMTVGQALEGDVEVAYDIVATESTTKTYGFIPVSKSESPYYIVSNSKNSCYYLIDVTMKDKQDEFKTLMDQSWDYMDGKTDKEPEKVHITGKVGMMPTQVQEFLKEYCYKAGMSDDEYNNMVDHTHCITTTDFKVMKFVPLMIFGVSLLCLMILLIKKIAYPKTSKMSQAGRTVVLNEDIQANIAQNDDNDNIT